MLYVSYVVSTIFKCIYIRILCVSIKNVQNNYSSIVFLIPVLLYVINPKKSTRTTLHLFNGMIFIISYYDGIILGNNNINPLLVVKR